MYRVARSTVVTRFVRSKVTTASAVWKGTLKDGEGAMSVGTGAIQGQKYSFPSRFENDNTKTNPEELIGAAHAGCYSMFLSALMSKEGLNPAEVTTTATVTLGDGPALTSIALKNETKCDGINQETFDKLAAEAKANCPITKALAGVGEITLDAKLL
jgi:osmotically inducible protein OsmC|eukprot:CAMPEP_0174284956 /NCGR_PEP_ID=MMETSP0809-20121228/7400_1 /TAXON_ID=73025 ORGANISM="Eutreptiella gymnastica-like, Strain CCMP1594" /NCGR_SAMPLE_ID=MMETSP0809 /ASSEMBLY_ACC=CAM_ASM_000658 /LENGTH=156 /DNA_ID=CAMNT_0015380631 /DNA_START=17 /DNA_END=487 /DNA_ORIENTATION=+